MPTHPEIASARPRRIVNLPRLDTMKAHPATHRQYWSRQQQRLRRLLMVDHDYPKALPVFLGQHEMVHSAKLHRGDYWSFQDEVLKGVSEAHVRCVPKGSSHSIAWLLWHITRIEDVTMNILLADAPQIWNSGHWDKKLESPYEGVGNELSPVEVAAISESIQVKALLAYRQAVGRRTRLLMRRLDPTVLWTAPAPDRLQRIRAEGAVNEQSAWLLEYWGGHPSANLLLMPATRHCFVHLNEIQRMLPKLRGLQGD